VNWGLRLSGAPTASSVLFFSRPRSEGWPHHGRTFSIYPCPLSFWLTLPRGVLSTSWCCPSRPLCVVFLACVHLALFLALSLSPGNSLVSSRCDHSVLASLLWRRLTVPPLYSSFVKNPLICFICCPWNTEKIVDSSLRSRAGSRWATEFTPNSRRIETLLSSRAVKHRKDSSGWKDSGSGSETVCPCWLHREVLNPVREVAATFSHPALNLFRCAYKRRTLFQKMQSQSHSLNPLLPSKNAISYNLKNSDNSCLTTVQT